MGVFVLAMGLGTWTLLAVLGIGLIFVVRAMMGGGKKSPATAPLVDLASLTIRDAKRGDMVTVKNAAPDYEDLTFKLDKIHRYEWGSEQWFELAGKSPHGQVALEWRDDDGLKVGLSSGKSHRIESVTSQGEPLTEDVLARFDEEQSSANTIDFDGNTFSYDTSHEVGFFDDGAGEGEGFYAWDFEDDRGKTSLSIEKWEGEAFEVIPVTVIDPADVLIFRG